MGTGDKTLVLTPPGNNCQGRPWKMQILDPYSGTTTFKFSSWISSNQIDTITIKTSVPTFPISIYLKIRYYDQYLGASSDAKADH